MAMAADMAMDIAGATVAMATAAGMLVAAMGKGTVADMRDVARDTVAVLVGAMASAVAGVALVVAATASRVAVMVVDGGSLELT